MSLSIASTQSVRHIAQICLHEHRADSAAKVKKGQELAIDTTSNTAEYCADGTPGQLLFDPVLKQGQSFRNNAGVDGCLMLVRAEVEN